MQLEEEIAKELAGLVSEQVGKCVNEVKALETRLMAIEAFMVVERETDITPPDDVVDSISKAVALLAEAPPLTHARDNGPVVVQFTPPLGKRVKTITTRRDDKGNLVARVVED